MHTQEVGGDKADSPVNDSPNKELGRYLHLEVYSSCSHSRYLSSRNIS